MLSLKQSQATERAIDRALVISRLSAGTQYGAQADLAAVRHHAYELLQILYDIRDQAHAGKCFPVSQIKGDVRC